jgi:nanoRNase/pAp phosphatase (c-di-AMP/oligoRNAs hydrolase)
LDYLSRHHAFINVAKEIAQWGADQELKACAAWLRDHGSSYQDLALYAARRPKPPTMKEQALSALRAVAAGSNDTREQHQDLDTIRRALEALND